MRKLKKEQTPNAKGGKHYTKAELEKMKRGEIRGNNDKIYPPDFLTVPQKREFNIIANELIDIGIITNLDVDMLGQYIQARDSYLFYSNIIVELKNKCNTIDKKIQFTDIFKDYESMKDKAFKQCQVCSNALGLNISSRCKITIPTPKEAENVDPMDSLIKSRFG